MNLIIRIRRRTRLGTPRLTTNNMDDDDDFVTAATPVKALSIVKGQSSSHSNHQNVSRMTVIKMHSVYSIQYRYHFMQESGKTVFCCPL